MKKLLMIIGVLLFVGSVDAEGFTGENRNDQFIIHGRLRCYNGGSAFRIWIIGSKRMLRVAGDKTPALDRVNKYFGDHNGWFKQDLFADFTVEPLEPDVKGVMRPVRIVALKHVVVTQDDKVIDQRDEL
jgi:hypothetical protein